MTVEQLAETETELYSTVLDLNEKKQTEELNEKLKTVFASYRKVHKEYSELAEVDEEALKRGLFIQWYSSTEPNYLTGIDDLDQIAEENIIDIIENKIQDNSLDEELKWMLNYYASWSYVFDRYKNKKGLNELILNKTDGFPSTLQINFETMKKRGQMGTYWTSLNHFKTA